MKLSTMTIVPMIPNVHPGMWIKGWTEYSVVVAVTSETTLTVRELYWYEKVRLWWDEAVIDEIRFAWWRFKAYLRKKFD